MRFTANDMTREKRDALLEWLEGEGIKPDLIWDNGRFSVHNGSVSGYEMMQDVNGQYLTRNGRLVSVPFKQAQKNPLPEVLR